MHRGLEGSGAGRVSGCEEWVVHRWVEQRRMVWWQEACRRAGLGLIRDPVTRADGNGADGGGMCSRPQCHSEAQGRRPGRD